ncbi:peptidoglycan-binding domain-containing protein [Maritalea sp.]|uniref:peptidoglycan-binding domain-containing protein n=1 Tax=Maritalea sp. TaxID=2003361 RepID=UPI003EF61286
MANYANIDQGPQLRMPGLKFETFAPMFKAMAKSPANTVFAAAMCISLGWAASNALFLQTDGHPAPLFAGETSVQTANVQVTQPVEEFTPPPSRPTLESTNTSAQPNATRSDFGPVTGNPDAFLVQSKLFDLGYFQEKVDGYYGPKTATAIREFEVNNGLEATGAINDALIAILSTGTIAKPQTESQTMPTQVGSGDPLLQIAQKTNPNGTNQPALTTDMVVRIQKGLHALGYDVGKIDGILGESTSTAIRKFESFNNYDQTGEVSPELITLLKAANPDF